MKGSLRAALFCSCLVIIGAVSERYYMEDECGKLVDMEKFALESVRVTLTKYQKYHDSMDCVFRVKAPRNKLFEIKILKNLIDGGADCSTDFLQIYDGPDLIDNIISGLDRQICSKTTLTSSYTSSGDVITIRFRSDHENALDGFQLLLTAYRLDKDEVCYDTEFQCKSNKRCISDRLVCDRYDDCTDASDECGLSTPAIIGLAVGGVVFVLAVIGLIVCVCYCKKIRGKSGSTRTLNDNTDGMFAPDEDIETDVHYYRPRSQVQQPVYDIVPYRPTSIYSVNGPYIQEHKPDKVSGRHVWITAPPEVAYISPYDQN